MLEVKVAARRGNAGFSYLLPAITPAHAEKHEADRDDHGGALAEVFHDRRATIGDVDYANLRRSRKGNVTPLTWWTRYLA